MYLVKRSEFISRSELDLTAANFPSQTKRIVIPSNQPIEELQIFFQVTLASAISDWRAFGLASALKKVTLNVNPGDSYDMVSASGVSLLVLQDNEGIGLGRSTRRALEYGMAGHVSLAANATATPSGTILRVCYRIPIPHPALEGQLRLASMLDCINHRQDPVLTLEFAPAAEFTATANPFSAAAVEVRVIRREMPSEVNSAILNKGGYIKTDIRDTPYDLAVSLNNVEKRFALPSPGDYLTAAIIMLGGTAASVLTPMDLSGVTTINLETGWRLESGGNALHSFRMKHIQEENDAFKAIAPISSFQPLGGAISTITNAGVTGGVPPVWVTAKGTLGAGNMGGALAAGAGIQDPAVVCIDFLTDGLVDAGELGSLLNSNFKTDAIRWELVAGVTTPAGQTSQFLICGRRYRDSVERFKVLPAA